MDPLSVIASSITIAGAVSAGLETVRTLHNAGSELHSLINEVSEITVLLGEVERAILERQHHQQLPQWTIDNISKILGGAKNKLHELDTVVNHRLIRSVTPSGEANVARLAWLRQRPKVQRLQMELRQTRLSLASLWGAANLSDMSRIQLKLDELVLVYENQKNQLSQHERYLEYISGQFTQPQPLGNTSDPIETSAGILSAESHRGDDAWGQNFNEGQDWIIARHTSIDQPLSSLANGIEADSALRIRASTYRRSQCEGWCSCICHRPCYLQTPQSVDFLLSSLFVGYSGFPVRRRGCNERTCRQQSIPTIKVSYYFPRWFLNRVVQFKAWSSYMQGPGMSLNVPRVIPDDSPVLSFAVQGNLDAIRSLFNQGLASPYDVGLSNGRTALHYAVNYNHRTLSKFLMDTGANANLEDKNQTSSISIAWERIFGRFPGSSSTADNWRCLFDDEDYLESRNFPPLHKTVLGLVRNDLQQQLEAFTSTIDDRDGDGLTALHWAAAKGDIDAVNALLEFGATPNVRSRRGHSPLTWASQSPSQRRIEIVQALLAHGADVNQTDSYNRTPLLNAATDLDDPACMQLFVGRGAELNWRDCHKRTSLGYAAKMGKSRNVSFLLSQGADPLIPDHWGHTPLSEAVQLNHHYILQMLLQHNHTIPNEKLVSGMSVLHLAAAYGDVETLRLLVASGDVRYLDPDECNAEGLTAQGLFDRRGEDREPELREAWRVLIETIVRRRGHENAPEQQNEIEDSSDSDDSDFHSFADAYEYQSAEVGSA